MGCEPHRRTAAPACALLVFCCAVARVSGEVAQLEILERTPFADGYSFGSTGPYERLVGKVCYEVDPKHNANTGIVDLNLAPKTSKGRVRFTADFFLLKPIEMKRGNGRLLYDVNNRGNKLALHAFNMARNNNPTTLADAGNGFLLRRGFTLLWSGWNADVAPGDGRMQIQVPVASQPSGEPVTGRVYSEICVDVAARVAPLCGGNTRVYPSASLDNRNAHLTMRARRTDPPTPIPNDEWSFARIGADGRLEPDPTQLYLNEGFRPGWLYDLVYTAVNPRVSGLGFAGVRDLVSFLRYAKAADGPLANPLARAIDRAYGFGISQSGRFLQDMLYQDFNRDEQNRTVFDGCFIHVAAAGRLLLNQRFAQVTRHGSQHEENLYPTDSFPFTTVSQEDPATHRRGDWLARSRASGHLPRIVLTATSTEYWNRGGSLLHTDASGTRDIDLDPAVRLYFIAGGQHLFAAPDKPGACRHPVNRLDYTPLMRALLVALDDWVSRDTLPPPSAYPRIADGTLVSADEYRRSFPRIPQIVPPAWVYLPLRLDLGPRWESRGIADEVPPRVGAPYSVLVPAVDPDGNERAGIRLPAVTVPVATYMGWNVRDTRFGAAGALIRWIGSQSAFPKNREERESAGDPRVSVVERYPSRDVYVARVGHACDALAQQHLLLEEDIQTIVAAAATRPYPD